MHSKCKKSYACIINFNILLSCNESLLSVSNLHKICSFVQKRLKKFSMNHLLEINNVVKTYGDYTALNKVSLQIPRGSVFGLLGPNGAGKTSLIRIINQITMPDSGTVFLDGEPLSPKHIADIGYLPEERGLYKSMKVGEQALYLAQLKGLSKEEAKKRLKYWFEKFDIASWWDKKIEELSKGMAQKVQFIVTVMHQPKLLIFDEPFSGFDPINAHLIAKEILQLMKEKFEVSPADFTLFGDELICNVKLSNNQSSNDVLSVVSKQGEVRHFVEKIPSANDIFIEAVSKNNSL